MYQGLVAEIPLGQTGLTGTKNLTVARPTDLLEADNITYENGTLEKEPGAIEFNTATVKCDDNLTPATIVAGWDWWPDTETQRSVIATNCGQLWKDSGFDSVNNTGFIAPLPILIGLSFKGTPVTTPKYNFKIKTGLSEGQFAPLFVEFGKEAAARDKKLAYVNGFNIPQVIKGDATSTYDIGKDGITPPATPLATLVAQAGNVNAGTHSYKVTFVNSFGETIPSPASNIVTTDAGNGQVTVSNIPVSTAIGTTARKLYRTAAGGSIYLLLATISNNTATTFTDNVADGSLGAAAPSISTASSRPVDWESGTGPVCGIVHENRLWMAGNKNSPHTLYFSTITDHENFAEGGTQPVYPGVGQTIVGMLSFKGGLVVWKFPVGLFFILTSDPDPTNWRVTKISERIGGVSPLGASLIDNDVLWMDPAANIQTLSSTLNFGNMAALNLSQQAYLRPFLTANVNFLKLNKIVSAYYAAARQVYFCVPKISSSINNLKIVVDYMHMEQPRFRTSSRDICPSFWLRLDTDRVEKPMIGDNNGQVWRLEQAARSKGISGTYTARFQTPHLDLSHADPSLAVKNKNGHFLEIVMDSTTNELDIDVFWDGKLHETITFSGTESPATFIARRERLTGSGRRISFVGKNSGLNKTFSLSKMFLHFTPSDERQQAQ